MYEIVVLDSSNPLTSNRPPNRNKKMGFLIVSLQAFVLAHGFQNNAGKFDVLTKRMLFISVTFTNNVPNPKPQIKFSILAFFWKPTYFIS